MRSMKSLIESVRNNPRFTESQIDFATQIVTPDTLLYIPHQTSTGTPETLRFRELLEPAPDMRDRFLYLQCEDNWDHLRQVFINFGCYDDSLEECEDAFRSAVFAGIPLFLVADAFDDHLTLIDAAGDPEPLPFKNWHRFTAKL